VVLDLESRRREHAQELHLLCQNLRDDPVTECTTQVHSVIPADTDVTGSLNTNVDKCQLDLVLKTNNTCVIKGAIIFAEHVFQGESLFVHLDEPKSQVVVPIKPQQNDPIDMLIKVA
jgi:hypothetical protein